MKKNSSIKIVFLDDKWGNDFKDLIEKTINVDGNNYELTGYNYQIKKEQYLEGEKALEEEKVKIKNQVIEQLKKLIEDKGKYYFVFLDFALDKNDYELSDYLRNITLNFLNELEKSKVFLVLYTGSAPSQCQALHNYLKKINKDNGLKGIRLYYKPLDLFFKTEPQNFSYIYRTELEKEIVKVSKKAIDEHWLSKEGKGQKNGDKF